MATEYSDNDWKTEAPLLAAMDSKTPFTVPQGYFDGLSEAIEAGVLSQSLASATPDRAVPENYFHELGRDIEARIGAEQIRQQVPAEGFTVPDNYFEDLKFNILAKTANKKQPFVRKLNPNWMRYAAAACITIAIGTGAYIKWPQADSYQDQISALSDEEILNYLEQHPSDIDNQLLLDIDPAMLDAAPAENTN